MEGGEHGKSKYRRQSDAMAQEDWFLRKKAGQPKRNRVSSIQPDHPAEEGGDCFKSLALYPNTEAAVLPIDRKIQLP